MANGKLINYLISIKIGFQGSFGISNPPTDFQNSRWWEKFFLNIPFLIKFGIWGFFIVYYEFNNDFSKFKMAVWVRRTKGGKLPNFNTNWYLKFFGVADYESVFIFFKLKMADPIWRNKIKIIQWWSKLVCRDFAFLEVIYENLTTNQ